MPAFIQKRFLLIMFRQTLDSLTLQFHDDKEHVLLHMVFLIFLQRVPVLDDARS